INDFREKHPDYGVHTEILSIDESTVVCRAIITDANGRQVSSGIAEEHRRASKINQTSATENCETSAVGRALAFLGMAGTEIASADEVAGAIAQQNNGNEEHDFLIIHANAVRENLEEIYQIKAAIANDDLMTAASYYADMDRDVVTALWRAPSKGGIWTTAERKLMQADGDLAKCIKKMKEEAA
ncbi:MAG: hypothetical protein VW715_07110, partial [Rhodospirillales bacterium]